MQNFTEENWEQLRQRYPAAYYFMLGCQNNNEYIKLNEELKSKYIKPERKKWIEYRIKDMESVQPEFRDLLKN